MPESEPKPKPLEAVPPGSGQGWKAVLKNGKQVVVHEIPVAPAAAAAAVPRIQRLADHPHPSLSPILAWGTDASGIWVAVEPNEGTPLSTVFARGRFTPHAAAALGTSVLSGIAALHEAGVAMGGFDATAVRITGNGEVRIAGHPVAAIRGAPSQSDLRADVRSCGMAICAAFGVDPAGAPAPPELPPGLVVTMRSMASGAMGPAVDRAQGALREMAGPMLAPDRQVAAQSELALRAGGRQMPPITPFIPGAEQAKPAVAAEETPVPRPASYEPPPRRVDTYSGLPRAAEPFSPPASYEAPPAPPAAPPAPFKAPPPEAAPPQPPAPFKPLTPPPTPAAPEPEGPAPLTWEPAPAPTAPSAPPPAPAEPAPPQPEPEEPAALTWKPAQPSVAASSTPAPAKQEEEAPAELTWEPVKPSTPAPAPPPSTPPATPSAPAPAPTWSPVQTGSWTPGTARVSSSEWTGEATPVPAPLLPEFRAAAPAAPAPTAEPAEPAIAPYTPPPIPRASAPPPVRKPRPKPSRPPAGIPSGRPPWMVPAAIAVVVLILLGGGGLVLSKLRSSTTTTTGHVATSPHATPSKKPSPTPTNVLQAIPVYAPLAAAPISGVHFCTPDDPCVVQGIPNQTDTNCTLNGPCSVDVGIFFSPTYGGLVSYTLKFFDRCTGMEQDVGSASAHAGNSQYPKFIASEIATTVQLPPGATAAALIAVTDTPAAAQSSNPLLLGASSC